MPIVFRFGQSIFRQAVHAPDRAAGKVEGMTARQDRQAGKAGRKGRQERQAGKAGRKGRQDRQAGQAGRTGRQDKQAGHASAAAGICMSGS
jgi:hypothetical protein